MTFYKVAQAQFLSVQFDNVENTFSINHLDNKMHSFHLNKSLTILKMNFYKFAQAQFLSVKFDNVVGTFS